METSVAISDRTAKPVGFISKAWLETKVNVLLAGHIAWGLIKLPFQIAFAPVLIHEWFDVDMSGAIILYLIAGVFGFPLLTSGSFTLQVFGAFLLWPIASCVAALVVAGVAELGSHTYTSLVSKRNQIKQELLNQ